MTDACRINQIQQQKMAVIAAKERAKKILIYSPKLSL
jgi:hypothetical protein